MTRGRVLVVGEALVDVLVVGDERSVHPGGSPLNVAVGLARLGIPTTLAAQVGDDDNGRQVTAHVEKAGVELIRLPPHRATGTATARLRPDGSATYDFAIGWDPVQLPDPSGFQLVHVGSIGATLLPGATAVLGLVRTAVSAGVVVSLDPNLRPGVTPDVDSARGLVEEMVELATVVKLSDEDASVLWPDRAVATLLSALADAPGAPLVVITRGPGGAVLAAGRRRASAPAPALDVADTIGAGDSVMSGLLAGLLEHDLLERSTWTEPALVWLGDLAVGAAAITCSRPGADPPWAAELPALARGPGSKTAKRTGE